MEGKMRKNRNESNLNEIRVNSWNELQDILFEHWYNEKLGRYRAPYAYRGLSDSRYELKTTLMRLGGPVMKLEPYLLINFRRYSGLDLINFDSMWYWMVLGQHHGLPTRLLDWTYSPLVAMHFATANIQKFHLDGVIWVVDFSKTREFLPKVLKEKTLKLDLPVFPIEALDDAVSIILAEDALYDTQSLKNLKHALLKLQKMSSTEFPVFLEPPTMNERIRNQFSLFSFMSNPTLSLDAWLRKQKCQNMWRKIIIPASLKIEIRDKLDRMGISERILFPGLDGLCQLLKRHYSTMRESNY